MEQQDLPIAELISRIRFDISAIIRKEMNLMRMELSDRIKRLIVDTVAIAGGALFVFLGTQVLIATIIIALSHAVPLWLSALIVGFVLVLAGGAACIYGIGRIRKTDWVPRRSFKLFGEDVSWFKKRVA